MPDRAGKSWGVKVSYRTTITCLRKNKAEDLGAVRDAEPSDVHASSDVGTRANPNISMSRGRFNMPPQPPTEHHDGSIRSYSPKTGDKIYVPSTKSSSFSRF